MKKYLAGIPLIFAVACLPPQTVLAEWVMLTPINTSTPVAVNLDNVTNISVDTSYDNCDVQFDGNVGINEIRILNGQVTAEECYAAFRSWMNNVVPAYRDVIAGQ